MTTSEFGDHGRPRTLVTASGTGVQVRALGPRDHDRLRAAIDRLSPKTYQLRFGGPKHDASDRDVNRFLDVGHDGREAIAALDPVSGEIIGVARFAPSDRDPGAGEVAVVVGDAWQGRGLGRLLVDELVALAAQAGYRTLRATSATENHAIAAVLRGHGFHVTATSFGTTEWLLTLPGP